MKKIEQKHKQQNLGGHIPHLLHKTCNSEEVLRYNVDCKSSPYFCIFKYAQAVKQKVWNEAKSGVRDWGETLKTSRFRLPIPITDFFADFEKKTDRFQSSCNSNGKVCCTCKDGFLQFRLGYCFCFVFFLPFSLPSPFSITRFYFWFE